MRATCRGALPLSRSSRRCRLRWQPPAPLRPRQAIAMCAARHHFSALAATVALRRCMLAVLSVGSPPAYWDRHITCQCQPLFHPACPAGKGGEEAGGARRGAGRPLAGVSLLGHHCVFGCSSRPPNGCTLYTSNGGHISLSLTGTGARCPAASGASAAPTPPLHSAAHCFLSRF